MGSNRRLPEGDVGIHLLVGFEGVGLQEELKSFIGDFRIGGIVLFRRNVKSPTQLETLLGEAQEFALKELGRRLWVAIDQEGGPVQRLNEHFTKLPAARQMASEGPEAVLRWARKAASELAGLGVQINLAPVLDVLSEDESHFMVERVLGSDPARVAELGNLWIRALQENGVSATAKHYPGLGQAESDPHHYAPVIRWRDGESMERDLLPFREAIRAGVHCVMTSHALYTYLDPEWPATLSPLINREWLRNRLGFKGVLLSDDMDMAAVSERYSWDEMVRQGMRSSIDFFLLCQHSRNIEPFYRALSDAVARDDELKALHEESRERIEKLMDLHASMVE